MSPLISEKVKSILMRALSTNEANKTTEQKEQKEAMLIKYRPQKSCDSQLLNDFQISGLCEHMSMYRNMRWTLLYRLSDHGVSMNTFIQRLQANDITLLIVED